MTATRFVGAVVCLALLGLGQPAGAALEVYKHDQFDDGLVTAASEVKGMLLPVQAGYEKGEAFGQLYRPAASDYPITILGLDFILAAPPNAPDLDTHATIELYFGDGNGPAPPSTTPDWTIHTSNLFDPAGGQDGVPLQGGVALSIDFDYSDLEGHPPTVKSGNIWVMVRYDYDAWDSSEAWGTLECLEVEEVDVCGCQPVGTLHDTGTTAGANVLNIIPAGCKGAASQWTFAEDEGVKGDILMRLRADVAYTACKPSCAGKACGGDSCGGSCGSCASSEVCSAGQCVVPCTPDCTDKACGDDGCGGSCGSCGPGDACQAGSCEPLCFPDCTGKACGTDGCAGTCGTCPDGDLCEEGACVTPCVPACEDLECGGDGCGGSCGSCPDGDLCEEGACVTPCVPICSDQECGTDGCGGSCGSCADGDLCEDGACVTPCVPACSDQECGDDGCGGSCGSCAEGRSCQEGTCTDDTPAVDLEVTGIAPDEIAEGESVEVVLTGAGFVAGLTVRLDATKIGVLSVEGSGLVEALVPATLAAGTYDVLVTHPDGTTATLPDGFEVVAATDPTPPAPVCGDGTCAPTEDCAACPEDCDICADTAGAASDGCAGGGAGAGGWLALLSLAGLAGVRRRRAVGTR